MVNTRLVMDGEKVDRHHLEVGKIIIAINALKFCYKPKE